MNNKIEIRECATLDELGECVQLQREVFALPEVEISPVRHLIVTRSAGGFILGAYDGSRLAGFVLSVPAFLRGERAFYSHMTGVRPEYQSHGIGSRLKWAQRSRALAEGIRTIKWTFEPVKARNAYFNLEKLGAAVLEYQPDFYGTDYATAASNGKPFGLASDRVFAEWDLEDKKVRYLAEGNTADERSRAETEIEIVNDWPGLVASDPAAALAEQLRIRGEFQTALARGLVARGFRRGNRPAYLLYQG
jgi:predicted GNAT superfamily acetyltransferase